MRKLVLIRWAVIFAMTVILVSCEKNDTVFIEDDDAQDLSIFSDKGNNVMSCYINGKSFRTRDRILYYGYRTVQTAELALLKDSSASNNDTLVIEWESDPYSSGIQTVSLVLSVKKGFSYSDFNLLQDQRLSIDGISGYFMINQDRSQKGIGSIYFHQALLMQSNAVEIEGQLSGIFEATLPSYKITRGRFDHSLPVGYPDGVVFF
ncbi:MAG: hypothetical protein QM802_11345 [Agriterribacter sp.]